MWKEGLDAAAHEKPVDEFDINSLYWEPGQKSYMREHVGYQVLKCAPLEAPHFAADFSERLCKKGSAGKGPAKRISWASGSQTCLRCTLSGSRRSSTVAC